MDANEVDLNISNNVNCKYFSVKSFHKLQTENSNRFNIFHSNVNGLETHFENLHEFLSGTPIDFDVLNITETSQKIDYNFKSNISIEGYVNFFTPSYTNKGGTGIYIKSSYDSLERNDLNVCNADFESTWVEIKNKKSKNIICGCIYRHPRSDLKEFLEYMEKCVSILSGENKDVYISGDFNVDLLKMDNNTSYQDFYSILTSHSYLPLIVNPTRVTNTSATVIDNIFTNCFDYNQTSGNILITISEHFPQFASILRKKVDLKSTHIYQRNYAKFSTEAFREDIAIQNWENNLVDVNDQFNDFYWRLDKCVDRHAPMKKLSNKDLKLKSKPWITSEIIRLIKQRDKLFARKKRQPNNENVSKIYKLFRNRVTRELKKSKKKYYTNYFEVNKNDIKNTWKGIKSIINTNNVISPKISQLNINGKIIDDPQGIANGVNNFFVNVGPNTEKEIPLTPPDRIAPVYYLKNRNQFNFIVAHISTEEILDIIKSLENKSTGPSSIPIKLLSLIPDLIVLPICRIINTSFTTGVFPDALKIVKVIPIHKGGSTQDMNNFRPISLLSIFDKIMEKLMHKRLYQFLEEHNILFENQFGFRKQKSTIHALIQITEQIKETIEKGKFGCGIFIDLKKAFDTVNHKILLTKLDHYGIRGTSLEWFQSYLSERKQYVYFNGQSSNVKGISCGVPQGSVLGPLLFLIYINDLPNISKKLKFFLFADDTNIYYESSNLKELEITINKELKWLNQWLSVNRLALNIKKTNYIIFHPKNKLIKETITLTINKKAIDEKKYVKYLGILIDSSLSWKFHIDNVTKKISRSIGVLYKLRSFVNSSILVNMYYSLIYPHFIYAVQVWGSACDLYINKLQVLQKRAVRMITFSDNLDNPTLGLAHTGPLFHKLEILRIKDIYDIHISKFVFECLHDISPIQFCSWFKLTSNVHRHATRTNTIINSNETEVVQTNNLFIPHARTTQYGLKSLKVSGPKTWNAIPHDIRSTNSCKAFVRMYKKMVINQYS